jgi:hypothetical protein
VKSPANTPAECTLKTSSMPIDNFVSGFTIRTGAFAQ